MMADDFDPKHFAPGNLDSSEALHLAYVLGYEVNRRLAQHPAITGNPVWKALADQAAETLRDLYQAIQTAHISQAVVQVRMEAPLTAPTPLPPYVEAAQPWMDGLPLRLLRAVYDEVREGRLADMQADTVRGLGERHWSRVERIGKRGLAQLGEALGGWEERA